VVLFRTALVLAIIGALNWLSVGLFRYDFVSDLFGGLDTAGARTIFTVVGIAGIVLIYYLFDRNAVTHNNASR
jgi:uncharacterized protein